MYGYVDLQTTGTPRASENVCLQILNSSPLIEEVKEWPSRGIWIKLSNQGSRRRIRHLTQGNPIPRHKVPTYKGI